MNIDKKFAGWVFGIVSTTLVTFVVAEERWNQANEVRSTSYLMYSTVVSGLKRDLNRIKLKKELTQQDKIEIDELKAEIKDIKEHQKGLL